MTLTDARHLVALLPHVPTGVEAQCLESLHHALSRWMGAHRVYTVQTLAVLADLSARPWKAHMQALGVAA